MATPQELQVLLTSAREAYHQLMVGGAVKVVVDQNGERIEYATANASRLAAYIAELERQLGLTCVSGPMKAYF